MTRNYQINFTDNQYAAILQIIGDKRKRKQCINAK